MYFPGILCIGRQTDMRILDIDLDLFLADCCPLAERGRRPDLAGHEPWSEAEVIQFLEYNCGLSTSRPVPGMIFETHDRALYFWKMLMEKGMLTAPFHVTHADAHSDLGIGYPGPGFVLYNVLPKHPDLRADPEYYLRQHKLDEANYLLFALAFRWISSLDNIRNPLSRPDIPQVLFPDDADHIRLSSLTASIFESVNGTEPSIPFRVFNDWTAYTSDGSFDFMSVAVSPRYSPAEADRLLPVIARYMTEVRT